MTDAIDFQIVVDLAPVEAFLKQLKEDVPFAASIALNRTIDEAQRAIQDSLSTKFTLRRETFVKRTIYRQRGVDFATKTHLQAGVRIHPERDFLAKFEYGGRKRPQGKALAIPLRGARPGFEQIVPKALRLGSLRGKGPEKVFVRNGILWMKKGRGKNAKLIPMYIFKPDVPIPASLKFVETGMRVIEQRWEANLEGVFQKLADGTFSSISKPKDSSPEPV